MLADARIGKNLKLNINNNFQYVVIYDILPIETKLC